MDGCIAILHKLYFSHTRIMDGWLVILYQQYFSHTEITDGWLAILQTFSGIKLQADFGEIVSFDVQTSPCF